MQLIIRVLLKSENTQMRTVMGAQMNESIESMEIGDRAEFDEKVCGAVWRVLTGRSAGEQWDAILRPLSREYGESTRSIRLGDVISVWAAEHADRRAETHVYEVTARAFLRKSPRAVLV